MNMACTNFKLDCNVNVKTLKAINSVRVVQHGLKKNVIFDADHRSSAVSTQSALAYSLLVKIVFSFYKKLCFWILCVSMLLNKDIEKLCLSQLLNPPLCF